MAKVGLTCEINDEILYDFHVPKESLILWMNNFVNNSRNCIENWCNFVENPENVAKIVLSGNSWNCVHIYLEFWANKYFENLFS